MFRNSSVAVVVALLAVSAAACKPKPVVVEPPVVVTQNPDGRSTGTPVGRSNTGNAEAEAAAAARAAAIAATGRSLLEAVYFDYDVADLSLAAQSSLNLKVDILRANPDVQIRIEGHCDSRGSTEYNLALGQRRAAAARQYMIDRGIAASRIQTLSMGEERPAMQGENEAAWARNRRGEFAITAGIITTPVGN
jgi:peptidoglycan-associated lipoprotein